MRNHHPNLIYAYGLIQDPIYKRVQACCPDGTYRPARPISGVGFFDRISLAWGVFTGKYDALYWEGQ